MNILYRLTNTVLLWILPVLLLITSITLIIPNSSLHKSLISYDGFYSKLSSQLQGSSSKDESRIESVILRSALKDVATESWLQNITETNIDNFVRWLNGDSDSWEVYMPPQDVKKSVANNIDAQVDSLLDKDSQSIRACNESEIEDLKSKGISFGSPFCLPPNVITGEESLTEFLGIDKSTDTETYLNSLISNNPLNGESIPVSSLYPQSPSIKVIGTIRNSYLWFRQALIFVWIICLALLTAHLLIAKASNRTIIGEIKKILLIAGINTIILCFLALLIIGGTNLFSSQLVEFLFPGLAINEIKNLVLVRVILVTAGLLQIAIIGGIVMVLSHFALGLLKRTLLNNTEKKNKKLSLTQTNIDKNLTHDGQFKRELLSSNEENYSFPSVTSSLETGGSIPTPPSIDSSLQLNNQSFDSSLEFDTNVAVQTPQKFEVKADTLKSQNNSIPAKTIIQPQSAPTNIPTSSPSPVPQESERLAITLPVAQTPESSLSIGGLEEITLPDDGTNKTQDPTPPAPRPIIRGL